CGRRHKERHGRAWLPRTAWHTERRWLAVSARLRLIGPHRAPAKYRHHYQPAICKLVVPNNGVSIVVGFACAAEPFEHRIGWDRTIQDLASCVEFRAFFGEDRYSRIHDLHYVIGPDAQTVIRWVAQRGGTLRALKPDAQSIEGFDELRLRPPSLRTLFNSGRASRARHHRDRRVRGRLCPCLRRRQQALQVALLGVRRIDPDLERPRFCRIRRIQFAKAKAEPIEHLAVIQLLSRCERLVKELCQVNASYFRSGRLKLLRRETVLAAVTPE